MSLRFDTTRTGLTRRISTVVRAMAAAWLVIGGLTWNAQLAGAEPLPVVDPELQAWEGVVRLFDSAAFDLAEAELRSFVEQYSQSARLPAAYLLLGEACFRQGRFDEALDLLGAHLDQAGASADQYRFWRGECLSRLQRFAEAAEEYGILLSQFPESSRRLDAIVGQAFAWQQTGQVGEAFRQLSRPDGEFLRLSAGRQGEENVAFGYLLMGETALASGQAAAGVALLERLPANQLSGPLAWQRSHLLARLQAELGQGEAAVKTVEGLVADLSELNSAAAVQFRADAVALAGEVLEREGKIEAALSMFERNLDSGVDEVRRREAADRIARIALERMPDARAVEHLEAVRARLGEGRGFSPMLVALVELRLRQYFALTEAQRRQDATLLQQAEQGLAHVSTNAPGDWLARAQFAAGWCGWEGFKAEGGRDRLPATVAAFAAAAEGLPRSIEQAVARFKAGDAAYAASKFGAAVQYYWVAATNYVDLPEAKESLGAHALYQIVRASLTEEDYDSAKQAMQLILEWYPQSYFSDRGVLVYGQAVGGRGKPLEARQLFTDYLGKFPSCSLAPQLGLAVARTWQQEGNWVEAAAEYRRWQAAHAVDHPSQAQAAYELAWSAHRAGKEPEAFQQFTNFVTTFPQHQLAPSALHWVADYHYRQARFDLAEREYQRIYQNTNWLVSGLTYHARMMAGRSAFRRTNYEEAAAYFTGLINILDTNSPAGLLPEAYFALGDTFRHQADTDNLSFARAIMAYSKIPEDHPDSRLVPLAWGEIGNCHFQLAKADSKQYDLALGAYTNLLQSATADIAARSQAAVGVAMCLEGKAVLPGVPNRAALLAEALKHYLLVTEGGNLKADEQVDPFWVERAGSMGAQLAEQLQRWEVAERLYQRLIEMLPTVRDKYKARLDRLGRLRENAARMSG